MNSHLIPFVIVWAVLAVAVLVLLAWRKVVSNREDDSLHVGEPDTVQEGVMHEQEDVAHKIEQIDKWGKILTVIAVAYGLILAGVYFYQMWTASSSIGV
ncbi:MAG TPA: hypothetical protein VKF41_12220 [Bryobacteraceae bacterium]|nr:hypothetical protein [Bryobacteraceae bacterium]